MMKHEGLWSEEVPPDIFNLITAKLSFLDILNMGLVCKNWYDHCKMRLLRVPWIIQPIHALNQCMEYAQTRAQISTVRSDFTCEAEFPGLQNRRICGTFPGGWVMTVDEGSEIRIINLLNGTCVELPSLMAFPGVIRKRQTPHGSFVYTIKSDREVDLTSDIMRDTFISKVAMSSSPDCDGCIVMDIHGLERSLSYYRIGSDMQTWKLANPGGRLYCYQDVVYHTGELCEGGSFLAVRVQDRSIGAVIILGLESNQPNAKILRFGKITIMGNYFHLYVLELSGQPLLACGIVDAKTNGRTIGFQLFLISVAGFQEVISFKDSSIFVGHNSSFSVSCIDYPRCPRNKIFFTKSFIQTDRRHRRVGFRCLDVGVFDLGQKSIHCDESISVIDGPPPIWMAPFLCHSSASVRFDPREDTGKQKANVNLVVIGHSSSGKSTSVGNLLQLHHVDNRACSNHSWVLHKLQVERERGFSIDNTSCKFETRKYCCTLTVSPGPRDFIRNMIIGASHAECALLIVDSSEGFEIGMSEDGQTREHALLAYALGVKQIICCCNKMDATSPNYSESRYLEIVSVMSTYLEKIGYNPDKITFVPVSGLYGKNLAKWSKKMKWYNGLTLLEAVNQIQEPKHPSDMQLCHPPRDIYYISGLPVSVGRDYSGRIRTSTDAHFGSSGMSEDVAAMSENLKRDGVASRSKHEPAKEAAMFTAKIFVIGCKIRIDNGFTALIDSQSYHNTVKVEEILLKIDKTTGKDLEVRPKFLENGDVGSVRICILGMLAESLSKYLPLGRFLLRDVKQTVAVGVIQSI